MNIPSIKSYMLNGKIKLFNRYIDSGLIGISCCSFVSALISRKAVKTVGLPIKEMFIYADDVEFTERISKYFSCFYVPKSKVLHKTKQNFGADITTASDDKLNYYFFDIRNRIYIVRKKGTLRLLKFLIYDWTKNYFIRSLKRKNLKMKGALISIKGLVAGIFFHPKIEKL